MNVCYLLMYSHPIVSANVVCPSLQGCIPRAVLIGMLSFVVPDSRTMLGTTQEFIL